MVRNTTRTLGLLTILVVAATAGVVGHATGSNGGLVGGHAPEANGGLVGGHEATGNAGVAATQDCSFPLERTDATGTTVTIEEEPGRIVTTAPSAAQTIYEIGAWDRVVGVSQFANFLDGFEDREVVSAEGRVGVNVERTVALEPDLVVAPDVTPDEDVENLREAGLTVFVFEEAGSVEAVKDQTRLMGELVGECEGAEETVDWMDEELATVSEAVEGREPVRALYVYSPDFGPFTSGENTFIGGAIESAGAVNLAAEVGIEGHQPISDEVVADQDPAWLIVNTFDDRPPENEVYNETTAVREGNVVVVNVNNLNQPGPRIVLAIAEMAKAFHPEAYAEANATATPTSTIAETQSPAATETPGPTDDTSTTSPTPVDGPGFGLVAGLVALVLAVVLGRRD